MTGQHVFSHHKGKIFTCVSYSDGDTGLISTRLLLDREQKENYTLIIVIEDHGDPPQQASRVLQVQVLDIDDHKPLFVRGLVSTKSSMSEQ
jgi:hypothetical protein